MSLKDIVSTSTEDFIAIDSSTTSIAFAAVADGAILKYGKIGFSGRTIYEKAGDMAKKTRWLFTLVPIKTIVIESTFYSNNPKTTANLNLAQGAIIGAACALCVETVWGVPPMVWQRGIGNGPWDKDRKIDLVARFPDRSDAWYKNRMRNERKLETIDIVNKEFGTSVSDNDVADALGIAMFTLQNPQKVMKVE